MDIKGFEKVLYYPGVFDLYLPVGTSTMEYNIFFTLFNQITLTKDPYKENSMPLREVVALYSLSGDDEKDMEAYRKVAKGLAEKFSTKGKEPFIQTDQIAEGGPFKFFDKFRYDDTNRKIVYSFPNKVADLIEADNSFEVRFE